MLTPQDLEAIKQLVSAEIQPLRTDITGLKADVVGLKADVGGLKKDFVTLTSTVAKLSDQMEDVQKYIKIESTGIEQEINETALPYFSQIFQGFTIKPLDLKNIFNPFKREKITELDGAYIVSSKHTKTKSGTIPEIRYLVIIEAKHNVTFTRINAKLEQIAILKKFLAEAKKYGTDSSNPSWTQQFKSHVKTYGLNEIDHIFLYVGGPTWEANMVKYVQKINTGVVQRDKRLQLSQITPDEFADVLLYMKDHMGAIYPKGNRYYVYDKLTPQQGGRTSHQTKKICRVGGELDTFTNHINHQYT